MSDGVREVQEAEAKAKSVLENAKKVREIRLQEAEAKARKIIEDAEGEASSIEEEMLLAADKELSSMRKKGREHANAEADKLRKTRLSKEELDKLADQAVKEIIGA